MSQIWKWPLKAGKEGQKFAMPHDACIVDAGIQCGEIVIWAEVEPDNIEETRTFDVVGTGWDFNASTRNHIATLQAGCLVWHIYEVEQENNK